MLKKISCILIVSALIIACSSNDNPDPVDGQKRTAMLDNVGTNVILPAFASFETSATALTEATTAYAADLKNAQKLTAAQKAWVSAAESWKVASLFSQGPVETEFLSSAIYFPSTNYTGIESAITKTGVTIDNAYIESLGATLKGLPAIEYLLFSTSGNNAVIGNFAGINGGKRGEYLKALSANLQNQATLVYSKWKPDGGNYLKTFKEADGRDINSSLGMLSNKMIDLVYTIKDERLGAPLGKRNNGTPQPGMVDAKFSNASLTLLKAELRTLENTFSGTGAGNNIGIDDILDEAGAKSGDQLLSEKIKAQFAAVKAKIDAIGDPLSTAITGQTAAVSAAYDEVKKLQVLMEVDMINNLGVLLTFSDNDGD
ncbi:imelysin family protein [Dyadobacter luticola]|uniref:Imelysin-like domain-containing protein n=1 Tax=Dyadobacter luticola TaxID=1979387 RepID=A0A5R9L4I5_9BACT|nr:imelysin family protein [Dyadobacter luticola]TLV03190.1 hypothetical protein FEN17_06140 [Dyadobacter luticola]